jgi:hypothetical protein
MGILLLIYSSNNIRIDHENEKEEQQVKYLIRTKKAAKKAALEYLNVKEGSADLKISPINTIILDKKYQVNFFDLRERRRVQRHRTNITI